jgi:hypothetical protein
MTKPGFESRTSQLTFRTRELFANLIVIPQQSNKIIMDKPPFPQHW